MSRDKASIRVQPFDRVRAVLYGTAHGDASVRAGGSGVARLIAAGRAIGCKRVVRLRMDFTNVIASEPDMAPGGDALCETAVIADGFLLRQPGLAVAITNADCAVGVLVSPLSAVVMHLGLACLWRADGAPTLLERATARLRAEGPLAFWVGFGIGPCCYGFSHDAVEHLERARSLAQRLGVRLGEARVACGPRRGQWAYDLREIAVASARRLGIERTEVEPRCTSCAGLADPNGEGYGDFYSNVRDTLGRRERNAALIGLGAP